jgi:hypothetical protein
MSGPDSLTLGLHGGIVKVGRGHLDIGRKEVLGPNKGLGRGEGVVTSIVDHHPEVLLDEVLVAALLQRINNRAVSAVL